MFRYDRTSAQVRGLENQATQLSGEARVESEMADGMLKDIVTMERGLPSSLKVTPAVGGLNVSDFGKHSCVSCFSVESLTPCVLPSCSGGGGRHGFHAGWSEGSGGRGHLRLRGVAERSAARHGRHSGPAGQGQGRPAGTEDV